MKCLLWKLGCATILTPIVNVYYHIILTLSHAAGSRETNVLAVIPGMHDIILTLSGAVDLRKTNILVVILSMHGIY